MNQIFKTFLFLLLLSTCSIAAFSQNGSKIYGIIKDNVNEPLTGATVALRNNADSFVAGTAADIDGNFIINDVPDGSYKMTISYLGYEDYKKTIDIAGSELNLGILKLDPSKGTTLDEVKIVEKAPPVQQKEDTTQFNAGSYKVNPDATAEDLIRKMPGMDLSTGKPQAQGESVTKVLVDGKPFFGDDPSSSLKNLPAEVIDKIQVYDEKSDQSQFTGFDDGNTSKTINIITKPNRKQGVFGKLYAGGGTDGTKDASDNYDAKYNAGGNINYFEGDRRISLIGQSNNINIQNFSSQDLVGISGTSGGRGGGSRGGGPGGGGASSSFTTNQSSGINKTNAVGFNYSDKWGKKVDVTASYFFNNSDNTTTQTTERDFVLPSDAGKIYNDTTLSNAVNNNHRFNMRFNYTIDSFNSLLIVPSLSFQNNNSTSLLNGSTMLNHTDLLNSTINRYSSDKSGNNLSTMLLYRHKFRKQGRTLSLMANGGYNKNDGNSSLFAPVVSEDGIDTTDQQAVSKQHGWNINSNVNYTEPLSKKSFLQVQYGLNYQQSSSDKRTNDFSYITNDYTDLNTALSNKFTTNYITNKGGLTYRYNDTNFNFNIGVDFQNANLDNQRELPQNNAIQRSFNTVLPNARFQYNFSKKKTLRLFYRSSTSAPSVSQLQDVVDNSNPLQISTGNPNLVQTYNNSLFMRYNATNTKNNSTFFAMLSAQNTRDYIANSTIIVNDSTNLNGVVVPAGGQYTRPENMNGYWNFRGFATYGVPINALKSNINGNATLGYVRTPGMVNLQKNYANNTSMGLGLVLSSNISDKIDFTLSTNANYNIIRNTLNTNSNTQYYNQSSRLSLNYIFWKGIAFNTELNHQLYRGLSAAYNQNYLLWNMSLGKKLFKKQQGEIKFSVYDLLKQNNSIATTVTESYIQYTQTNVLQRYFMLTFTYNLRFFKGGASMKDTENNERNGGEQRMFGPPPGAPPGGGPGGPSPGMMPPMD
ncbi:outer membrane beta-barrel protein [Taibaiella lutea]|uniref:Outer membrane beta-barrel protein n=1 Tax=Taibaiella lutea TaxID=2608001 RepID=A0A5M6CRU3_9BACT|nr:TonB-dependent receptor [Taibaiella lutea]KAA5537110.1 outer membrane beta-barrel protein [Taibaiella lutea]